MTDLPRPSTDTTVVLLSGGIDSATCLALADAHCEHVHALHVTYGQQTADVEHERAEALAYHYDVPYDTLDATGTIGHYGEGVAADDATFEDATVRDGRSSGYVPMRNLLLIGTAAGYADAAHYPERPGGVTILHGAQAGDDADYPDCRPAFIDAMQTAIDASTPTETTIAVDTPLIDTEKQAVIEAAHDLGVPLELTYSCYRNTDPTDPTPCGVCPACTERTAAFEAAGVPDPILSPDQ